MSTVELGTLNVEILRNLGIVAEDEGALKRVAKYLRRVVRELTTDPTEMTKEEFFRQIDEAKKEYERGEYTTLLPGETVTDMLKRCGYDL